MPAGAHRQVQALAVLVEVAQVAQVLLPQLQQLLLLRRRQPQHLRTPQTASLEVLVCRLPSETLLPK